VFKVGSVEDAILKILTRLDEIGTLLDTWASESKSMKQATLPTLRERSLKIAQLFFFDR